MLHLARREPAISDLGTSRCADEELGALIIVDMIQRLAISDLVIADISIANANVYYEIGVRHAAKPAHCVIIAADWAKPVFDLAKAARLALATAHRADPQPRSEGMNKIDDLLLLKTIGRSIEDVAARLKEIA